MEAEDLKVVGSDDMAVEVIKEKKPRKRTNLDAVKDWLKKLADDDVYERSIDPINGIAVDQTDVALLVPLEANAKGVRKVQQLPGIRFSCIATALDFVNKHGASLGDLQADVIRTTASVLSPKLIAKQKALADKVHAQNEALIQGQIEHAAAYEALLASLLKDGIQPVADVAKPAKSPKRKRADDAAATPEAVPKKRKSKKGVLKDKPVDDADESEKVRKLKRDYSQEVLCARADALGFGIVIRPDGRS